MTRYCWIIFLISGLGHGCDNQTRNDGNNRNACFVYPKEIDSLHLQELYDSARWYVYTWHCDGIYNAGNKVSKNMSFGELPLKFRGVSLRKDVIEINFYFFDEIEMRSILTSMTKDNKQFLSGVAFDVKTRKRVYMLSPSGFHAVEKGSNTRYDNPLQPEVLDYIKNNFGKLNICFREEVERRGVMSLK
ncbi:hypothetical protein HNQ91_001998 [Filimonas zeae]|uniref:Uncharacterized protein n=1 Tax=Filimonas zeae TaxID=1737353 RepID=A0A917IWZ0_9BACT|nr:hypothetical protein [Filimonas zeae]MDR6338947.1 hypothetical protein [Filimonas zeae]GGH65824.1 hypothetical protein GCM10011379_19380 [Filimonas zeae]